MIFALLLPILAHGQAYTSLTSTALKVDDGSVTAVYFPSGANVCFQGVNNLGASITHTPSGGSPVTGPVCQTLNSTGTGCGGGSPCTVAQGGTGATPGSAVLMNQGGFPTTGGSLGGTDMQPHPPINVVAEGAVCNGTTNSTTAVQTAITAACASASHPPVYFPSCNAGYLITDSLNATYGNNSCTGVVLESDGKNRADIIANFPSGKAYPALDFLGCGSCGINGINVFIPSGSYATLGVLTGLYGSSGDGSNFRCKDSSVFEAYPGTYPALPIGIVIPYIDENAMDDCTFNASPGAVIGNGLGRASSIVSEYGTIGTTSNSMTQFSCHNCLFTGVQGLPALQLTGIDDTYTFSGRTYADIQNASTNSGGIVELTHGSNLNSITAENFRTENQTPSNGSNPCGQNVCGVAAIYDDSSGGNDIGWFGTFALNTDSTGYALSALNSGVNLENSTIRFGQGSVAAISWPGAFNSDTIDIPNWGSATGPTIHTLNSTLLRLGSNSAPSRLVSRITTLQNQSNVCTYAGCLTGGVAPSVCSGSQFVNGLNPAGALQCASPSAGAVHGIVYGETTFLSSVSSGAIYSFGQNASGSTLNFRTLAAVAPTFSCSVDPTLTIEDCGSTAPPGNECSSPTPIASITLSAANTPVIVAVGGDTIANLHYYAWKVTAGTCTALQIQGMINY